MKKEANSVISQSKQKDWLQNSDLYKNLYILARLFIIAFGFLPEVNELQLYMSLKFTLMLQGENVIHSQMGFFLPY